jgi:hypothetical protein
MPVRETSGNGCINPDAYYNKIMSFFGKRERIQAEPEQSEDPLAKLAALKKRKADLETYVGTDAWAPDDRVLLAQLNNEIAELEDFIEGSKAA